MKIEEKAKAKRKSIVAERKNKRMIKASIASDKAKKDKTEDKGHGGGGGGSF